MQDDRNKIDRLFDECVDKLSSDNINEGVEALEELAHYWAKADLPYNSFIEIKTHLIEEARKRTDTLFIQEKINLAEKAAYERRNSGNRIIITH